MRDSEAYCGFVGFFTSTSLSFRVILEFLASARSFAQFSCSLKTVADECVCGKRNGGEKIVGGEKVKKKSLKVNF